MASQTPCRLPVLPDELLLHVLSFLDIPDLLNTSRSKTAHRLRHLCLDPVLHTHRLLLASSTIGRLIPIRPSLAQLMQHRIYITRTTLAARALGRNLIKIKLNRSLQSRPSAEYLVEQGVLPKECLHLRIAPSLIPTRRRIEKERIKDVLRHWIEEWNRKRTHVKDNGECADDWPGVRMLARRFAKTKEREKESRWGGKVEKKEMPTRAKVLGLRRFWEALSRGEKGEI